MYSWCISSWRLTRIFQGKILMAKVITTLSDLSEVVAGLMILGRLSPSAVIQDNLIPPYDELHKLMKSKRFDPETVIEKIGISAYRSAKQAAESVEGMKQDWPLLLEQAASRYEAGRIFSKVGARLMQGEDVDMGIAHKTLSNLQMGYRSLTQASKITPTEAAFTRTGWPPLDEHLGGLPIAELTTFGAPPGIGKTWSALKIASGFGKQKRRSAIFSLEMTSGKIVKRLAQYTMSKKVLEYIYINDDMLSPEEISSIVSRTDDIEIVIVDFAELMLRGESGQQEQAMASIYLNMAWIAKNLNIPVFLLAQLNRDYSGGIPTIRSLRYSGMAEVLSSVVLIGYNPNQIYQGQIDQQVLPIVEGKGYIIIGKCRHKFPHNSPGAIQIEWLEDQGWGERSSWFPMVAV